MLKQELPKAKITTPSSIMQQPDPTISAFSFKGAVHRQVYQLQLLQSAILVTFKGFISCQKKQKILLIVDVLRKAIYPIPLVP
jgi:hypothetical protein